jgi:lipid II:glycine glycyltransferase (peptidoglycan interpeptide bridge formation enzyme)
MQTTTDDSDTAVLAPPAPIEPVATEAPAPSVPASRWQAWDDFVAATPTGGFMQSSWWAEFRVDAGYAHFATILKDTTRIYGGAVVMKFCYSPTHCFYYIPDGPILPEDEELGSEIFEAILATIEERRKTETHIVSHLRIEPRWSRLPAFVKGWRTSPELTDCYREPRNTLYMDLRLSDDDLLAQMKPKGRYNIRVAQRHGVQVVEDNSRKGLADFLRLYKRMAERKDINAKPSGYFRTLASTLFDVKRGSLYFAEYQGRRIAAAIVVHFGKQATYFFGGSDVTDRNVMAPYLLHFEIRPSLAQFQCFQTQIRRRGDQSRAYA